MVPVLGYFLLTLSAVTAPTVAAAQTPPPEAGVEAPALTLPASTGFAMTSAVLGQIRQVYVALPRSHARTDRTYPVVIILDGEAHFARAALIADTLARLGHAPEAIVVGLPNMGGFEQRLRDMTPPGLSVSGSSLNEGGDRFLDFIQRELTPVLAARYRAGGPLVLIGHSSGGVIATHAAATRGHAFPVVIAVDAPIHLQDGWLAEKLSARAAGAEPGRLRYISLEARFGWPDEAWAALVAAAPADWRLRREKLVGESHESMMFLALYQGLKLAFDDYSVVAAPQPPRASALEAFAYYRGIEQQFGATLPPPERGLGLMVFDLLTEGRVAEARQARDWLVQGYGTDTVSQFGDLSAMIARAEQEPPLTETVADLLATPMAMAEEIGPYVGEWRGYNWVHPDARNPLALTIRIVDGRVEAEIVNGSGESASREAVQYLRVTPDGLAFGRLNGMRPRAMMIGEGRRTGDRLEGFSTMRGIRIPLPNGDSPQTFRFSLERRP